MNTRPVQILEDVRFFAWLAQRGITTAPGWSLGERLVFEGEPVERAWRPVGIVSDLPAFINSVLNAAQQGGPWWLMRRGGGPWTDDFGAEGGMRNASLDRLIVGLGYGGASGALRLGAKEIEDVWLIVHNFFVFAWSLAEDLVVIPDDCSCILTFSNEGFVIGRFPTEDRADAFQAGLALAQPMPSHQAPTQPDAGS